MIENEWGILIVLIALMWAVLFWVTLQIRQVSRPHPVGRMADGEPSLYYKMFTLHLDKKRRYGKIRISGLRLFAYTDGTLEGIYVRLADGNPIALSDFNQIHSAFAYLRIKNGRQPRKTLTLISEVRYC